MFESVRFDRLFRVVAVLTLGVLFLSGAAWGQHLPGGVRPLHYSLVLAPNLSSATFTGKETIDVLLTQPSATITLNAAEIVFVHVSAEVQGKTLQGRVSLDPSKEQATLNFGTTLPAGPLMLRIDYRGILNDQLRGFYLSKTARRNYAVTQFEPTDARRAFPSFDEPADKATFDISLVVAQGDTAISNTNIISDTPLPEAGAGAGQHIIKFAQTPKMSTYLVAFLVGDFKCLSGHSDGVPLRVCATPDKVQYGAFALAGAEFFLHYYDTYFGIKYPMPKLDMIALPDFEAGAMENFGAITYRETALLLDPKTASLGAEKLVAVDVAHEMSHQWFGDMVTMKWWDNLWLNEGFATWMENKAVAAWKPEWKMPQDVAVSLDETLNLDAERVTRTIRAPAETPDQINEMFDGITYGKAAAVLLMVENYLGEEIFRQGAHRYLEAHMYGNATAEDFWNAQTEVSRKPVDRIMQSLVEQPGEPLLTFSAVKNGRVQVTQKRFFSDPQAVSPQPLTWTLPVCLKTEAGPPACQVVASTQQLLQVPQAPLFYGDASGKGYYRSRYDAAEYQSLLGKVEQNLQPAERISLLGSEFALTRADQVSIGDFLNLAVAVKADPSADVIGTLSAALSDIDERLAATPDERTELAAWVRTTFAPALKRLGPVNAGEAPEIQELQVNLFELLGSVGRDPQILSQARQITGQYLQNPGSVDASLAGVALQVAATDGDRALFDRLQALSETSNNPQLQSQALRALALFRSPPLVERALDDAVSGRVRNQDSVLLIARELSHRDTRDLAWKYLQQHWPKVKAQITTMMGSYLVESAGSFCSPQAHGEVAAFFAAHPVPAAALALERAEDSIDDCVALRSGQEARLKNWLSSQSGADGGSR